MPKRSIRPRPNGKPKTDPSIPVAQPITLSTDVNDRVWVKFEGEGEHRKFEFCMDTANMRALCAAILRQCDLTDGWN